MQLLMQSDPPYCDTNMVFYTTCNPLNSLEVSRIAGFRTDLCETNSGGGPPDPSPFQYNSAS